VDNSKFPDLQVTQYFDPSDKNYFDTDVKGLTADTLYGFNFQWVFEDEDLNAKYNTIWSNTFRVQTIPLPLAESTDVVATWGEDSLQITWKSPTHSTGFQIALTGNVLGTPTTVYFGHKKDLTTINQKIVITKQQIMANFGNVFQTTLSGLLKTDYINAASNGVAFAVPAYVDPLSGLAILDSSWAITPVDKGFSVSWDAIPTTGTYWETVVYQSSTPTGTYLPVGSATNAPVTVKEINTVYIKIRHRLITGGYSAYSNYKVAAAYLPIIFDETPPNEVTVNSATWSGNDLLINYTMPATDPGTRFKVILTTGIYNGSFYDYFPATSGTFTYPITNDAISKQLSVNQSTSYTGKFISIDPADNPTSGTNFSTGTLANPGAGVTPTFTLTGITNGYTATWTAPSWATYIKVWEGTTSGFTPNDSTNLVYSGPGPAIINTLGRANPYSRKYIVIKYFGSITGQQSEFYSAEQFIYPINPDSTDTTPPLNSTATAAWNGNNIEVTPTFTSGEDSIRCIIELTASGQTRPFLRWKNELVAGKFTITQDQLYSAFGSYYTAFAGVFKTADSAGNINTGTNFSVASKTNPLSAVTPTFALTAITNGYTATWVLPATASYAKVYESATSWGAGNPTESDLVFSGSSPAIIKKTVYTLRYVKIKYVTIDGFDSLWSAESTVTPIDAIAADANAPLAPSAGITANSSIDTSGTMGFNGVINLSWTAVSDSTLRGYRIRFRPYKASAPFENYSYVDSGGTGTSYRLSGLAVGATYEIGIASYDEFNNTTGTYSSFTNQTISGDPAMSNYITAGLAGFQFGSGIKDKDGTQNAAAQGIYLSNSNYWYLTAANTAKFKVGGSAANFLEWTGDALNVDGNITAKGGSFSGNIELKTTGASIWNGALNSGGTLVGDGFVLNNNGLSIKKGTVNLRLDTSDGGIYADYGQIAGWKIDSSKIERLTLSQYSGISSSGNYSFYAGATASGNSGGDTGAAFWVKPDGTAKATGIAITGGTLKVGANFDVTSSGVLTATNGKFNGEITAASGTITGNFGVTTGIFFAGAAATGVNRVVMNQGGLFGYKNTAGVDTTNFSFPNDTGLFYLGSGSIAGWLVDPAKIEKSTGITYAGMSSTGTFAFYAGGVSTGTDAPFRVTHLGAVNATNISIVGTGNNVNKLIDAGGNFYVRQDGFLYATSAEIEGKISATSGTFKGQVDIGTAAIPAGVLRVSSGTGTILIGTNALIDGTTTAAITASSGNTTNFYVRASDGYMFSQSGKIGGWSIGTSKLSGGGGTSAVGLQIDSTAGGYAFWAGAGTPATDTPFSVTNTGVLRATGAIISGAITVTSGRIGNQTLGWNINGTNLESYGTPDGTNKVILNSSTGEISGGKISGSAISGGTITGTTIESSATTGKGKVKLDGANSRIMFNSDQTYSFSLDSDTTSVTTYSYSYGSDSGADAGDGNTWYGAYYGSWATPVARTLALSEAISLKRTDSTSEFTLNNPRLTLSIGGSTYKSFLKISNQGSGPTSAAYSSITLQEGGLILTANYGALKIENMASAAHYSYTSANNFRVTGGTYLTGPTREVGVPLVIKSDGSVSTGRAIFKTSASEVSITSTNGATNSYMYMGQDGDIMFSTAS